MRKGRFFVSLFSEVFYLRRAGRSNAIEQSFKLKLSLEAQI